MKQSVFTVIENTPVTERVSRLRLRGDCSAIERPGQFVNIALPGLFLRRPFSVSDWNDDSLTLHYELVGKGTELLRSMQKGEKLDLLTGLGNGFDLSLAGERPLLVGGGSGVSPLLGLARRLVQQGSRPQVILGFDTREDIFLVDELFRHHGGRLLRDPGSRHRRHGPAPQLFLRLRAGGHAPGRGAKEPGERAAEL